MYSINIKNNAFDNSNLKLNSTKSELKSIEDNENQQLPKPEGKDLFLRGPIIMDWITVATALPGQAGIVGFCIWFQGYLKGDKSKFKLSMKSLREKFNVERNAAYRALEALQNANLIDVERHVGRCPIVTVLDPRHNKINHQGGQNG